MTYDQFWNADVELVKYYRESWKIKQEVRNQECWLQGMYFYEAIIDVAPVLHAFADKNAKPREYSTKPYELHPKKETKAVEQKKEVTNDQKAKALMEIWMVNFNKRFEEGGEKTG